MILYIKKNVKKLSLMSPTSSLRRLNQYHMNLIGDKTCKILNKGSLNYTTKFQKMMSSLAEENMERFEVYDEMLASMKPKKSRTLMLKNTGRLWFMYHKIQRNLIRMFKRILILGLRIMKYIKVIRPDSIYKLMLDIFSLGIILFCIFFIPLHNIFWFHQNMYSDLILFLIIIQVYMLLIGLNVGYISNGIIFTNRKLIFQRFLSLETLSDTVYLVLLFNTWLENGVSDRDYIKSANHLFLSSVMLFLLIFKFFKLKQLINYLVEYLLNLSTTSTLIFSLSQVCFFLIVCAHILSCQWILITKFDSENGDYTWLDKFQLKTADWTEIYLYGYYWAVVTMLTVGYGDILPMTYLEHIFAIIAMMITCCVFAYIMNTIGDILEELNNQRAYLRKQQNMVNHFFKDKKIDNKLQLKIKKHLVNVWNLKKENKIDTNSLIEKIPEAFREEVLLQIYGKYVKNNKVLKKNFSTKLLEKMAMSAKEKVFIPDDIIIMENTLDNCAYYYIHKGKAQLFYGESYILKFLTNNDWFGELSFISGMPRKASAKSVEYSSMFSFSRSTFLQTIKSFYYDYEKFCYIKDRINVYEYYGDLQVSCLSCRSCHHLTKQCGYITLKKNAYKPEKNNIVSEPKMQEMPGFVRRDTRRINALLQRGDIEEKCEQYFHENYPYFEQESPRLALESPLINTHTSSKFRKNSMFQTILDDNKEEQKMGEKKESVEKNMESIKSLKKILSSDSIEVKKIVFDKLNFELSFEKAKTFDLYFPHNNYTYVIKKSKHTIKAHNESKANLEIDKNRI